MIIEHNNKDCDVMAIRTVKVTAKKLEQKKKRIKYTKRIVIFLFLLLLALFFILMVIYKGGNFTVTLDPNFSLESGIVLYDNLEYKTPRNKLYAEELEFMDNISVDWLPSDIDTEGDGAHNGDNYIAYTFYVGNEGERTIHYWYEVNVLDVIKNVDEAIRIMIYQNGNRTIYAKLNSVTGEPEEGTTPFYSEETPVLQQRTEFQPGDIDKYTVVIYLEGDDPECVDAIIGGEIKLNMRIMEEHVDNEKEGR